MKQHSCVIAWIIQFQMKQIIIQQIVDIYRQQYRRRYNSGGRQSFHAYDYFQKIIHNKQEFQIELMTDNLYPIRSNSAHEFNFGHGNNYPYTSPVTPSEYDGRSSRMASHQGTQAKKIFGFEIFVDNDILGDLVPLESWFSKVQNAGSIENIRFNLDLNIPDLNGRNIQIYDKEMEKKYQSCRVFLSDIYQIFKKVRREPFSIIIFVPEGMVSLLIGTKGYQINKIMRESHTTIVVNQPINKMTYRTVKIQGYHSDIAKACRIIYEILEDKSSIAYSIQKEPSQLDYSKARVKTKYILSASILNYLLSKKKLIMRKVEDETKCLTKYREDTSSSLLKRDQQLCVVFGKLQDVQAYIVMLINLIHIHNQQDRKPHQYTFKMLIPSNYVTKLIGQKGYMIRDIIERSGGAQIKILSDRQSDRDTRQCIISINGTRQNKIDATCLILQQIECFKNGGPILQSGKSINQNLAQQFKNSLPLHTNEDIYEEIDVGSLQSISKADQNKGYQQIKIDPVKQQSISQSVPVVEKPKKKEQEVEKKHLIQLQRSHASVTPQIINYPDLRITKSQMPPEAMQLEEGEEAGSAYKGKQESEIKRFSPEKAIVNRYEESKRSFKSPSKKSQKSDSPSSRSRRKQGRVSYMRSSSPEYQQDKQFVEVKLVIPRKLAEDHKQLKYIKSLSGSEIIVKDQKVQGSGQAIISISGTLRNNSQCIKMLQKRIMRLATPSSFMR